MPKVTEHKFRNLCNSDCVSCRKERDNMCSAYTEEYSHCFKTREEHEEVEEWSAQII